MRDVYIIEPLRTPIGKYGGILASIRPDDLAAYSIAELVRRTHIPTEAIDDVILGCSNQAGEDNRNVARIAALLADLPTSVPGVTVNRLCASSLEAVIQGARAIRSGEAQLVIVGGVESMSRAPFALPKNVSGQAQFGNIIAYDTALGWRFPNERLKARFPLESMGETAENLAEYYAISRAEQDAFAYMSHYKAIQARNKGIFAEEIIPVPLSLSGKQSTECVDTDEQPRADTSIESLSKLKPAFRSGGTVTAGNSSSLNDGAAVMLLASESAATEYNLQPLARYVSSAVSGVNPRHMGIGPVEAIPKALHRAGIQLSDVERIEINEAFAAQVLACIRGLKLESRYQECLNVYGGAIALGHPLGMSGARIVGTLVRGMRRDNIRYGVASLCVGVGQGIAAVFERV
ncbi:MAG: thiolase family protein [Bacteroidota bacterium]|nr:thiolase family protein [Candidatus Kapabacteria bacterium]MDW8220445.1 thiolase family protein [Bacteroidota bacterium]